MGNLTEFAERMKAVKKEMEEVAKTEGKAMVKSALKDIFDKFPEIKAIRWTQYTPYFNDGDACTFSVNEVELTFTENCDADADEDDEREDWKDSWSLKSAVEPYKGTSTLSPEDKKLYEAVLEEINTLSSNLSAITDAMEIAFGDHVQVTATPKGLTIDEYEHD